MYRCSSIGGGSGSQQLTEGLGFKVYSEVGCGGGWGAVAVGVVVVVEPVFILVLVTAGGRSGGR